ncbi:DUF924 domain-containing protein [Vibrio albus]|uniref:DUF924 domain-containing protein n=1 Tax=Vibrio albus TaxID=2200953 RepID=A0A2U3BAB6_9VIBR|nr:DUF924 family protein [Vibrio albus]PWI33746.1 DUF924 domain-containing protein [Vibrio albus]
MYQGVIKFWFTEIDASLWWQKDKAFDSEILQRFGALHKQARAGELYEWRDTAAGSLAEVIILDQFSRNIYRDRPEAFASDPQALTLAQFAIARRFDAELPPTQRSFLYLPFMHSESAVIHGQAVRLYESLGNETYLDFELRHKAIIDRFGRYPHRNAILGRKSTAEEAEFLTQPNSGF